MISTGVNMKKLFSAVTLPILMLLPASALAAYTADTVEIKDPKSTDLPAILNLVIGWILALVGGLAVLFIIWGGIQYVTSAGNKDKAETAKKTLTYAIVGLIVIVLAEVIVSLVTTLPTSLKLTN